MTRFRPEIAVFQFQEHVEFDAENRTISIECSPLDDSKIRESLHDANFERFEIAGIMETVQEISRNAILRHALKRNPCKARK